MMVTTTRPIILLKPKKTPSLFERFKRLAGRTRIVPGVDVNIDPAIKAGVASQLIPGVRTATLGAAKFVAKRPRTAIAAGITGPTAAGILTRSPKARRAVVETFSPKKSFERGKGIGDIVEDPSQLQPKEKTKKSVGKRVKDVAKKAGLIGAGAAAGVGAAAVASKRVREAAKSGVGRAVGAITGRARKTDLGIGGLAKEKPERSLDTFSGVPDSDRQALSVPGLIPQGNVNIVQIQNVLE